MKKTAFKPPPRSYSAATLAIKRPGTMTKKGRKDIINWLRDQAAFLEKHGKDYTADGTFRASFRYFHEA
jgi:hypothetical protein